MNLANKLTILRVLLVPMFMACMLTDIPHGDIIGTTIFVLAALTDLLDGYIARKRKEVTNLGKLLDPLADKLLMSAALVVLLELSRIPSWIAILIIGREFLVTGLRAIAAVDGIVIAATNLAKVKTVAQLVSLSMLLVDTQLTRLFGFSIGMWALYAALGITIYTGYDYFVKTFSRINMH